MATIKLAEALLRRKELQQRLDRMGKIHDKDLFEIKIRRVKVEAGTDEVTAGVPKMTYAEFDAEYNYYAKALRQVDAVIQQANWNTAVEVRDTDVNDFPVPETKN